MDDGASMGEGHLVAEPVSVRRTHGFHPLVVKQVVQETADTRSFVLDVPDDLRDLFDYRAGQFCTFRVRVGDEELLRCYSMSSAPETDADLTVTVKRVPGRAGVELVARPRRRGRRPRGHQAGRRLLRPRRRPPDRGLRAAAAGSRR